MLRLALLLAAAGSIEAGAVSPESGNAQPAIAGRDTDWTLLADLATASPVVLRGTVAKARRLSGRAAADMPPGEIRMLVAVDLSGVLKAPSLLPARAEWIWQGRKAPDGKPPIRAGDQVLAFLSAPLPGPRPEVAQFRLVAPEAQRPWRTADDSAVRAILADALAGNAMLVTAVADAFHTEGTVEGRSESQFFLETDRARPLTLVVRRQPDSAPEVRVATGELIAGSAIPVAPQTLLWRALACGLPDTLPPRLDADPALAADFHLARALFGPCGRRATIGAGAAVSGSTG